MKQVEPEKTDSYFDTDEYAKNLGVKLIINNSDNTLCELEINNSHMNGVGSVHGAVIFSLADIAFATACNKAQKYVGMQADIRYLNRPKGDRLYAYAHPISSSNRVVHYQVDITDNKETKVAQFTGIAYKLTNNPR